MGCYRILSIDGSGVRGVYAAELLRRLDRAVPGFVDAIDLVAGTSSGAIIALALAQGRSPAVVVELYSRHARTVFERRGARRWLDPLALWWARHGLAPLRAALAELFGDTTLGQLPRRVLVPTFALDRPPDAQHPYRSWRPRFFHNFPEEGTDWDESAVDVILRSCAAPTYLPSYEGCLDGGVIANDPSMCAVAQALDPATGGQRRDDLRLLSIGTGLNLRGHLPGRRLDWGRVRWGAKILDVVAMMLGGDAETAQYQCRRLLGERRYRRIAPLLPEAVELDDWQAVPRLIGWADEVNLAADAAWLRDCYLTADKPSGRA